jgi:hypothetical protein
MERHKYWVEVGEYHGGNGAWTSNSQNQFEVIVECREGNEGERMVRAQYGGERRCRVQWRGRA